MKGLVYRIVSLTVYRANLYKAKKEIMELNHTQKADFSPIASEHEYAGEPNTDAGISMRQSQGKMNY